VKTNELAFFGKMAASVTHELKNVLAVINETNGLTADLLGMLKDAPFPYREKFERSVRKIEEQVHRGVEITSRFNSFAHSVDYPLADVDLNSIVAQTVSMAYRLAALRNVELRGAVRENPIMLFTSAFTAQMALTIVIEAFIKCMDGGSILIKVTDDPGVPGLEFDFESHSPEGVTKEAVVELEEWGDFQELASVLDIHPTWRTSDGGLTALSLAFNGVMK
jgi:signal transduction histidine kinase